MRSIVRPNQLDIIAYRSDTSAFPECNDGTHTAATVHKKFE